MSVTTNPVARIPSTIVMIIQTLRARVAVALYARQPCV